MGFSLQVFFEDLERIQKDNQLNNAQKADATLTVIRLGRNYAIDCNMINLPRLYVD